MSVVTLKVHAAAISLNHSCVAGRSVSARYWMTVSAQCQEVAPPPKVGHAASLGTVSGPASFEQVYPLSLWQGRPRAGALIY